MTSGRSKEGLCYLVEKNINWKHDGKSLDNYYNETYLAGK